MLGIIVNIYIYTIINCKNIKEINHPFNCSPKKHETSPPRIATICEIIIGVVKEL